MKQRLVIWGAGGHARVVADIVRLQSNYEVVGFIDDVNLERTGTLFDGQPILGGRECLDDLLIDGVCHVLIAVGNCPARVRLAEYVMQHGFTLGTAIHPSAIIAGSAHIGAGTVVMATSVVNPGARVGTNVIINTAATVDHDCEIGDGVHIGPGSHLGGDIVVGRHTFIGIGTILRDKIQIGEHSVIGAGSVVVKNIPSNVLAYGVPAKIIQNEEHHGN